MSSTTLVSKEYLTNLLKNSFLSQFIIYLKTSTWILVICAKIVPDWTSFIFFIIELLNNKLHGLLPPGGLVSPPVGFAPLSFDQGVP